MNLTKPNMRIPFGQSIICDDSLSRYIKQKETAEKISGSQTDPNVLSTSEVFYSGLQQCQAFHYRLISIYLYFVD